MLHFAKTAAVLQLTATSQPASFVPVSSGFTGPCPSNWVRDPLIKMEISQSAQSVCLQARQQLKQWLSNGLAAILRSCRPRECGCRLSTIRLVRLSPAANDRNPANLKSSRTTLCPLRSKGAAASRIVEFVIQCALKFFVSTCDRIKALAFIYAYCREDTDLRIRMSG